jgi:hypothetical protein
MKVLALAVPAAVILLVTLTQSNVSAQTSVTNALALSDRPIAVQWAKQGLRAAKHLQRVLRGTPVLPADAPLDTIFKTALKDHFKTDITGVKPLTQAAQKALVFVNVIHDMYTMFLTMVQSDTRFRNSRPDVATVWPTMAGIPAYEASNLIWFTPEYRPPDPPTTVPRRGVGLPNRVAIILHEFIHLIDPRSGEPAIHISEYWDEWATQSQANRLHNPSAYNVFASTVCYGTGSPMFGLGPPRFVNTLPAAKCL